MIKLSLLLLSLLLTACSSNPEQKAQVFISTEELLQQGVEAYQNDAFAQAQKQFQAAFELYQSVDNNQGMQLSRLNLLETALAVNDFNLAEQHLSWLRQQLSSALLNQDFRNKLQLLEVKCLYQQQQYQAALTQLQPLLTLISLPAELNESQVELLAMAARLELLVSNGKQLTSLQNLQAALANLKQPQPKYQALLQRNLALAALKKSDYRNAQHLLIQALDYYKTVGNRRPIASCLEDLAEIELAQQHKQQAVDYLTKALLIRRWLKDNYKTNLLTKQIENLK